MGKPIGGTITSVGSGGWTDARGAGAYDPGMDPIAEILDELRAGRMVVLVDDEDRENEGDLVCAAEHVTAETVNFMVREARGVLCLAMTGEACDRLELGPQTLVNTATHGTAFTVSVDAHPRFGVTTGVSAQDRATTVRVAVGPGARAGDLVRPGHVNPLRARDGGVLVRAGQTEGSVDLCRLAGLTPAAVIIEVMNTDGSMARLGDLRVLCGAHGLKMCSVADVIQYRLRRERLVRRVGAVPFETGCGRFTLLTYRSEVDAVTHVVLACGGVGELDEGGAARVIDEPVLVRMHSQNLLGDVFDDLASPTGRTLRASMGAIQAAGRGALVYLRHEGLEVGVAEGGVGEESSGAGGGAARERGYGIGSQILRDLGVRKLRLLTDHPFHPGGLEGFGLSIEGFVPVPK